MTFREKMTWFIWYCSYDMVHPFTELINSHSPPLFQHKVVGFTDDCNFRMKRLENLAQFATPEAVASVKKKCT